MISLAAPMTARRLHNTVRGFAGFATVRTTLLLRDGEKPQAGDEPLEMVLVTTRLPPAGAPSGGAAGDRRAVPLVGDALRVTLDDGSELDVVELQVPGKKAVAAKAFCHGLRGRRLFRP